MRVCIVYVNSYIIFLFLNIQEKIVLKLIKLPRN